MDSTLIKHFRSVAQHLSFTRAAEVTGVTQPQLSRMIRRLEDIVGHELFDRSGRKIALTPAGLVFLAESQHILDRVNLAKRRTAAAAGSLHSLRVGYTSSVPDQPCSNGVRKFRHQVPDVDLDLVRLNAAEQANALRAGELDVGLMQLSNCSLHDLNWRTIGRTQFVLAIPADWPFPHDRALSLGALRDYPFVLSDPRYWPDIHAAQIALCQSEGFIPKISRVGGERAELLFLASAGFGACFLFEPALQICMENVRILPISDPRQEISVDFVAAWHSEFESVAANRFVDCVQAEARQANIAVRDGQFHLEWCIAKFD